MTRVTEIFQRHAHSFLARRRPPARRKGGDVAPRAAGPGAIISRAERRVHDVCAPERPEEFVLPRAEGFRARHVYTTVQRRSRNGMHAALHSVLLGTARARWSGGTEPVRASRESTTPCFSFRSHVGHVLPRVNASGECARRQGCVSAAASTRRAPIDVRLRALEECFLSPTPHPGGCGPRCITEILRFVGRTSSVKSHATRDVVSIC